ncbi:hypothetical protein B296_00027929 [Ensete ventricosum]|uniref:Uncharacterized protein n=1 Tax=Ensete ventricosum TaxID=4639 RepID=A0A426XQ02_ENSVE|nr:hypothetical protein B296_00027929 [Ensete ventricosum]
MLKPVVPLDRVSLEVYSDDFDHRCFKSLVEAEIPFNARDSSGWVSIFPFGEVHPHGRICRVLCPFSDRFSLRSKFSPC